MKQNTKYELFLLIAIILIFSSSFVIATGIIGKINTDPSATSYDQYVESLSKKQAEIKYEKNNIPSEMLGMVSATNGQNGAGFIPVDLYRNSDDSLYMIYQYPIFTKIPGAKDNHQFFEYALTFGVGVAKSDDNGKTWSFVGQSKEPEKLKGPKLITVNAYFTKSAQNCKYSVTKYYEEHSWVPNNLEEKEKQECEDHAHLKVYFHENDLSEIDYHGMVSDKNGGLYVFYSVVYKRFRGYENTNDQFIITSRSRITTTDSQYEDLIKDAAELKDYKNYEDLDNIYELRAMHISGNSVSDMVLSNNANEYLDDNFRFVGFSKVYSQEGEKILTFFVEKDKLYSSDYFGRIMKQEEYSGFFARDNDDKDLVVQMQKFFSDYKGNIYGFHAGNIYKKDGQYFTKVQEIGNAEYKEMLKKLPNIQSAYPYMMFDSGANLHIIFKAKSPSVIPPSTGSLYYQFIPTSVLNPSLKKNYQAVYIFTHSDCNQCNKLKDFLRESSVGFTENPSNPEFSDIKDSGKLVTVVVDEEGDLFTVVGFNKIEIAKKLGIEIKPAFIDNYISPKRGPVISTIYPPADDIDEGGYMFLSGEEYPVLVLETASGIKQYYFGQYGWIIDDILPLSINDNPQKDAIHFVSEQAIIIGKNDDPDDQDQIDVMAFNSKKESGPKYTEKEVLFGNIKDKAKYGAGDNYNNYAKSLKYTKNIENKADGTIKINNHGVFSNKIPITSTTVPNIQIWTNRTLDKYYPIVQEYPYFINNYDIYTKYKSDYTITKSSVAITNANNDNNLVAGAGLGGGGDPV